MTGSDLLLKLYEMSLVVVDCIVEGMSLKVNDWMDEWLV